MSELNTEVQQYIRKALIAEGWLPCLIDSPNHPGSKGALIGPRLCSRLAMTGDMHGKGAWFSGDYVVHPGYPIVPRWRLLVCFEWAETVLAVARVIETVPDAEPIAWFSRRLNRRLRGLGWRRSTGWLRSMLAMRTEWVSPTGAYRLVVPSPRDRRIGGAALTGPGVLVELAPTTPVGVVAALADAVAARRVIGAGEGS